MTDEEIPDKGYQKHKLLLLRIADKAQKGGYKTDHSAHFVVFELQNFMYNTIFSHEFAKTFFPTTSEYLGEQEGWSNSKVKKAKLYIDYDWKYHLQTMVLEENPLLYLAKFL